MDTCEKLIKIQMNNLINNEIIRGKFEIKSSETWQVLEGWSQS